MQCIFFFNMNLKRFCIHTIYFVKFLWHKLEISYASTFAYVDPLVIVIILVIRVDWYNFWWFRWWRLVRYGGWRRRTIQWTQKRPLPVSQQGQTDIGGHPEWGEQGGREGGGEGRWQQGNGVLLAKFQKWCP